MPIYEYECSACGHRLETIQKMSDPPLQTCDNCNQPSLRKMMSAAGFRLKGTGWYVTDFKDKGKPKPASVKGKDDGLKEATGGAKKGETTSSQRETNASAAASKAGTG